MQPYERFDAWKACHELILSVYRSTRHYPSDERYGLTSQTRRAAYSAAANIVEGSAKRGTREFRRFLDISLGSLAEVGYALRLASDLDYLPTEDWTRLAAIHERASKLTWGLYKSIA